MTYLFEPPAIPAAPVRGQDARYPIRRIFCVGRNYAAHAREMGVQVDREAPFYFTKTALAYAVIDSDFEGEDWAKFDKLGQDLRVETAKLASARYLDGLPTGGSMTGHAFRDLEMEAEVLQMTRDFGIGAQFGGKYFCHDVRVIRLPRHGASCPVGIGVSCSADRQSVGKITGQGVFVEQLGAGLGRTTTWFGVGPARLAQLRIEVRKALRDVGIPHIILHVDEQEAGALGVERPDTGERPLVLLPHVYLPRSSASRPPLGLVDKPIDDGIAS